MNMKITHYVTLCLMAYSDMAFPSETHCKDETKIIFNCRIANTSKIASICATRVQGQDVQYLQYMFGNLGKAELVFPKKNQVENGQFSYDRQYSNNAGWLQYDLTFTIGRNKYNVYWMESSKTDGIPKEKVDVYSGVSVLTSSGKSIDFRCDEYMLEQHFGSVNQYNVVYKEP